MFMLLTSAYRMMTRLLELYNSYQTTGGLVNLQKTFNVVPTSKLEVHMNKTKIKCPFSSIQSRAGPSLIQRG